MAPSFATLAAIMAAVSLSGTQAARSYQVTEEYNPSNFLSKFNLFTGSDPTHGFVNYRDQANAESLGLISVGDSDVYIGVNSKDTFNVDGVGRDSVRLESTSTYSEGLIIASFSHLPAQACGTWPAFWAYGDPWLTKGELDIYEGWNLPNHATIAAHTDLAFTSACSLLSDPTRVLTTATTTNCDNNLVNPPLQFEGTGCAVQDTSGIWGSSTGGTLALELTSASLKVWNWLPNAAPSDIGVEKPDPSSWGLPALYISGESCDLSTAFRELKLVLNIDFCGDTAGNSAIWEQSCGSAAASCAEYVGANPGAFEESYWKVQGITVYQLKDDEASSISSASTAPSTSSLTELVTASTQATTPSASISSSAATGGSPASTLSSEVLSSSTQDPTATDNPSLPTPTNSVPSGAAPTTHDTGASSVITSTIFSTSWATITSCAASITDCPVGQQTSSVIAVGITVVPAQQLTTSTVYETRTSTITSCAASVIDCPVGSVTTEVAAVTTTVCPVAESAAPTSDNDTPESGSPENGSSGVGAPDSGSPDSGFPSGSSPGNSSPGQESPSTESQAAPSSPGSSASEASESEPSPSSNNIAPDVPADGNKGTTIAVTKSTTGPATQAGPFSLATVTGSGTKAPGAGARPSGSRAPVGASTSTPASGGNFSSPHGSSPVQVSGAVGMGPFMLVLGIAMAGLVVLI